MERSPSSFLDLLARETEAAVGSCLCCDACLGACPTQRATAPPFGEVLDTLDGADPTDGVRARIASCAHCGACIDACPMGLDPYLLQLALTAKLKALAPSAITQAPAPPPSVGFLDAMCALQITPGDRTWLESVPDQPPHVDIVLFLGCVAKRTPNHIHATQSILKSLGVDFVSLHGGGLCCGSRYLVQGMPDRADQAWESLVAAISAFSPKTVLFHCGTCYSIFAHRLSQMRRLPFETKHLSQYLVDNSAALRFENGLQAKVAVHDSCGLGRKGRDYTSVRALLRRIPGITIAELSRTGAQSPCCGAAAEMSSPEIAAALRRECADVVLRSSPEILAVTCDDCEISLSQSALAGRIRVEHYSTLLAAALGHPFPSKLQEYLESGSMEEVTAAARPFIDANPWPAAAVLESVHPFFSKWWAQRGRQLRIAPTPSKAVSLL